ncbi:MAG: hypothetical protein ABH986_03995 [archaeon]
MPSTTELTEKYLGQRPSIRDCLKNGVINYSKLARKISRELDVEKKSSVEAVLVACRRYAMKLKKEKSLEDKILKILKNSELEIKNKIVVFIIDKKIYGENLIAIEKKIRSNSDTFYAIEGVNVFTVIVSEKYLDELNKLFKRNIINVSKNLAMIIFKSSESLESTPGVTAYLYSLFGERGINITETMSCWTDTIFVVSEKDIPMVMNFLKF